MRAEAPGPDVCVRNLDPPGRRRRLWFGVATLLVAGIALAAMLEEDLARAFRLLLFVPLLVSALGFVQAGAST